MRIVVLTGDHFAADPTKPGAVFGSEDFRLDGLMRAAFRSLPGHRFEFVNDHSDLVAEINRHKPDLVVNFCDTGYRNQAHQELNIPALLDIIGVPYTGCPPASMVLCYDKEVVRLTAGQLGVPVPREAYIAPDRPAGDLPDFYPALIKPNRADGSLGIRQNAVVADPQEAQDYIDAIRLELPGRALLMQEYLPGPEYTVGLIGNQGADFHTLPVLEVDFSKLPNDLPPILCYESKTIPTSPYYNDINYVRSPAPETQLEPMRRQARLMFERFSLQDYGRFDFRADTSGVPRLLEINPNPAWDAEAKFALMAGIEGKSYAAMLNLILETAIRRITNSPASN